MLLNNLEDIDFNKYQIFCGNINDVKPECHTRCMPWEDGKFKRELKRFGEPTIPKSAVYLYPTTKKDYTKNYLGEVGYEVSLPFRSLLSDKQLVKFNDAWKMNEAGSGLEWEKLILREGKLRVEGLLNSTNLQDAMAIIEREVKEKGMCNKIKGIVNDLWNTQMVDVASGIASKWVYKYRDVQGVGSPWNVAMKCSLFPYINTHGIRGELWHAIWLRYIMADIMAFSSKQKIPTHIFVDEIEGLLEHKALSQIITKAIREFRSSGVGITMVNHSFERLPRTLTTYASSPNSYLYVFSSGEDKLASWLKRNNFLTKTQVEELPHLPQFNFFAIGRFILYDIEGNKEEKRGAFRVVRLKPPNCMHFGG